MKNIWEKLSFVLREKKGNKERSIILKLNEKDTEQSSINLFSKF